MKIPKKVVIFGGGVGGLSTAHQLSKLDDYDITIYEKKNAVGGLARSSRDSEGCATEYCWRVFFGFYDNLLEIMNEIPTLTGTTRDNLTEYKHLNISDKKSSIKDMISLWPNVMGGMTSCDKRMDSLDDLTWWNSLKTSSSSNLFREIGGWLGMDRYKGSYRSVIKVGMEMQILEAYLDSKYKDFVTTKPTTEALFNWWVADLKRKGVKFVMNTELDNIETIDFNVSSATVRSKHGVNNIKADYYIFSIPIEELDRIVTKTPVLYKSIGENVRKLRNDCLHIQLSFQLYFSHSVSIGDKNAFLHIDSPWDLIVLSYDNIYEDTKICKYNPRVKGAWSVAACTAYIPGIVYGKTMLECTYNEILVELWTQLTNSKELTKIIRKNNAFELSQDIVVKWSPLWPGYNVDTNHNRLVTVEPKFTNNVGSYALRPSFKTALNNLFISTAYIKETIDIFSMEAACIAGKKTAHAITKGKTLDGNIRPRPLLFAPFRALDSMAFSLGIPLWFFIILIIAIFCIAIYIFKK